MWNPLNVWKSQGEPPAGIQVAIFDSIGILAHGKYNM